MIARRSTLNHCIAGKIDLPLLVPAFSSKGFGFSMSGRGRDRHEFSEIAYELADFGKQKTESVLISAYDLHFNHFNAPKLSPKKIDIHLRNTCLVLIDSGGYELISDFDMSEPKTFTYAPKKGYGLVEYELVLKKLANQAVSLPLVISNFDHLLCGKDIMLQIKSARTFFGKFDGCMTDFILKPWTPDSKLVDPSQMSDSDFSNLNGFDIIGVTEKELGNDIFERLKRIAKLRHRLDKVNLKVPIHIWGGLDPIMTPLYFFAGAEIFDGVSWLRYAYKDGLAINRECYSVCSQRGVTTSRRLNHAYASLDNISALAQMEITLQQWVDYEGKKFDMFHEPVRDSLKKAYGVMKCKIDELKGGA